MFQPADLAIYEELMQVYFPIVKDQEENHPAPPSETKSEKKEDEGAESVDKKGRLDALRSLFFIKPHMIFWYHLLGSIEGHHHGLDFDRIRRKRSVLYRKFVELC